MTRKRPDVQPCGERHESYMHCATCWPIPAENSDKLQGPPIGTRVHYTSERYPEYSGDATLTERSYVWAPNDPSYHGGSRRYDWAVIRFDNGKSMSVDHKDLTPL